MDVAEKPSGNKVIGAVAIFFILGFIINLALNYNQNSTLEQKIPVGDEILKITKENSNILLEQQKKIAEMTEELKFLKDNCGNSSKNTGR